MRRSASSHNAPLGRARRWLLPALLCSATAAPAGPPYVTDDPVPTDPGKWEVYGFVAGTRLAHATEGETGFDINYGAAKDVQLTAVVPIDYTRGRGGDHAGLGDLELAVKLRFVHQREGSIVPDIAFFPEITLPTARARFGGGRVGAFFPLWAQKDLGAWSMFGGGGYAVNPGRDARNSWLLGYAVTRELTPRLSLGTEIYHSTPEERGGRSSTGMSLGASYALAPKWSLLASGGPLIANRRANGRYSFYLGLLFHD